MRGLTFLEALGETDEKDLVRAESYFKDSKEKMITGTVFKVIGTAASVLLIVGFALFMWYVSVRMKDPVKPSESTSEPVATATETAEETAEPATDETKPSEGLLYKKLSDGTYSVSGTGSCRDKDIVIPEFYKGAAVIGISDSAFEDGTINSVIIPATVRTIMKSAFKNCTKLQTVTVIPASSERQGSGLRIVCDSAFYGCSSLKEIVLPDTVTDIEREAFKNCTALQSVRLPAGLGYSPGTSIFEGCTALEHAEFPEGLRCVPSRVFFGCTALETVILPESLTEIEFEAFTDCASLCEINIPKNVSAIGSDAFRGCTSLKKIVIPDKVTDLGSGVFSGCTSLCEVKLGKGIDTVGAELFKNCVSLTGIALPEGITDLYPNAFDGCGSLASLELPASLKRIEDDTGLRGCGALKDLTVSADNKKYYSEGNCVIERSGKKLVLGCACSVIPDGVKTIGVSAFVGCTGLKTVVIPDTVKKLEGSFAGCADLVSIIIPTGVTGIGEGAFSGCSSLYEIAIPDSVVTERTTGWFSGCTSLAKAYIGSGITYLHGTFTGCEALKEVTFGALITEIDGLAFENCVSLETVNYPGTKEQWFEMYRDRSWDFTTGEYKVNCSDGVVDKHDVGLTGDKWTVRVGYVKAVRRQNGKTGLTDEYDRALTEFKYEDAEVREGMIILTLKGRKYLFNTEDYTENRYGRIAFKELKNGFDDIRILKFEALTMFIIELDGKSFPASYNAVYRDINCVDISKVDADRLIFRASNGKYGFYSYTDEKVTEIYPQTADEMTYYNRSDYGTGKKYDKDMLFVKENGKYAVFGDDSGRIVKISDFIYDQAGADSDGAAYVVRDGEKRYLNFLGSESDVPATEYLPVILQVGDLRIVRKFGEKEGMGVIDGDGKYVIEAGYAMIFAASEDRFFCAKENGRNGVIYDSKGMMIADGFTFSYPLQAQDLQNTLYIVGVSENGKTVPRLIDKNGNVIKPGDTVLSISYGEGDTYIINGKTVFTPN